MTVNELLVLTKAVKERLNYLRTLSQSCAVAERSFYTDREKETTKTPQYDIKLVDKKMTELVTWLFKADAAIKQSNALTQVALEANVEALLSSLE
jgi:hypothetical protein